MANTLKKTLVCAVVVGLALTTRPAAAAPTTWETPIAAAEAAISLAVAQWPGNPLMWRWSYGPAIM